MCHSCAYQNVVGQLPYDFLNFNQNQTMNSRPFSTRSSFPALLFNGKLLAILRPWHIHLDTNKMLLTVKRRNWHLISFDEETYAFKSVRNVKINTHLFGADVSIKVYAGEANVYYIPKKIAKQIKNLLLNQDWNKKDTDIIIDLD